MLAENLVQMEEKVGLSEVDIVIFSSHREKTTYFFPFGSPSPSIVPERTTQAEPHLSVRGKRLLNHSCQRKDTHSGSKARLLVKQVRGRDKKGVLSI